MVGLVTHAGAMATGKREMTPDPTELRVQLRNHGVAMVCYHPRCLFLHVCVTMGPMRINTFLAQEVGHDWPKLINIISFLLPQLLYQRWAHKLCCSSLTEDSFLMIKEERLIPLSVSFFLSLFAAHLFTTVGHEWGSNQPFSGHEMSQPYREHEKQNKE